MQDAKRSEPMGKLAREHVRQTFSREAFGSRLDGIVRKLAASKST